MTIAKKSPKSQYSRKCVTITEPCTSAAANDSPAAAWATESGPAP